ncbi:BldC family transcriptional regulator [Cellulomonas palmilytica]|uniref:BldC family transcriptional regulator n=1 Tax=Cellulomonas palmilytica TaxID=2608402 RepID=UPI001F468FBD|nr:BldC family transcriptional regulator [Cellulomonas palmilytica]UJP41084.1 helix-turn-helix domain-containing protein [Cellulomonas palmilytica]
MTDHTTAQELLTPQEVAMLFGVDPKTVTRWARAGRLNAIRTLGGHRRYLGSEVRALITPSVPTQAGPRD